MSNPFLQSFAADVHEAFIDAGMADFAQLTPAYGAAVACRVFVDRDPHVAELAGVVIAQGQAMVRIVRAGVATAPRAGDVLALVDADGAALDPPETFTLVERAGGDEGSWVFVCRA